MQMDKYDVLIAEPRLTRIERFVYRIICNLDTAQLHHRFDDPNLPPPPRVSNILRSEKPMQEWVEALGEYRMEYGFSQPREPLPLADLWSRIDPPDRLAPRRTEANDLFFDRFLLSLRSKIDREGYPWEYIVGAPAGAKAFRCIAKECSGRMFYSTRRMSHCEPPAQDDFAPLRIHTNSMCWRTPQFGTGDPNVIRLFLPGCFQPWGLMTHKQTDVDESIVGA
jgi:hypothetical protein